MADELNSNELGLGIKIKADVDTSSLKQADDLLDSIMTKEQKLNSSNLKLDNLKDEQVVTFLGGLSDILSKLPEDASKAATALGILAKAFPEDIGKKGGFKELVEDLSSINLPDKEFDAFGKRLTALSTMIGGLPTKTAEQSKKTLALIEKESAELNKLFATFSDYVPKNISMRMQERLHIVEQEARKGILAGPDAAKLTQRQLDRLYKSAYTQRATETTRARDAINKAIHSANMRVAERNKQEESYQQRLRTLEYAEKREEQQELARRKAQASREALRANAQKTDYYTFGYGRQPGPNSKQAGTVQSAYTFTPFDSNAVLADGKILPRTPQNYKKGKPVYVDSKGRIIEGGTVVVSNVDPTAGRYTTQADEAAIKAAYIQAGYVKDKNSHWVESAAITKKRRELHELSAAYDVQLNEARIAYEAAVATNTDVEVHKKALADAEIKARKGHRDLDSFYEERTNLMRGVMQGHTPAEDHSPKANLFSVPAYEKDSFVKILSDMNSAVVLYDNLDKMDRALHGKDVSKLSASFQKLPAYLKNLITEEYQVPSIDPETGKQIFTTERRLLSPRQISEMRAQVDAAVTEYPELVSEVFPSGKRMSDKAYASIDAYHANVQKESDAILAAALPDLHKYQESQQAIAGNVQAYVKLPIFQQLRELSSLLEGGVSFDDPKVRAGFANVNNLLTLFADATGMDVSHIKNSLSKTQVTKDPSAFFTKAVIGDTDKLFTTWQDQILGKVTKDLSSRYKILEEKGLITGEGVPANISSKEEALKYTGKSELDVLKEIRERNEKEVADFYAEAGRKKHIAKYGSAEEKQQLQEIEEREAIAAAENNERMRAEHVAKQAENREWAASFVSKEAPSDFIGLLKLLNLDTTGLVSAIYSSISGAVNKITPSIQPSSERATAETVADAITQSASGQAMVETNTEAITQAKLSSIDFNNISDSIISNVAAIITEKLISNISANDAHTILSYINKQGGGTVKKAKDGYSYSYLNKIANVEADQYVRQLATQEALKGQSPTSEAELNVIVEDELRTNKEHYAALKKDFKKNALKLSTVIGRFVKENIRILADGVSAIDQSADSFLNSATKGMSAEEKQKFLSSYHYVDNKFESGGPDGRVPYWNMQAVPVTAAPGENIEEKRAEAAASASQRRAVVAGMDLLNAFGPNAAGRAVGLELSELRNNLLSVSAAAKSGDTKVYEDSLVAAIEKASTLFSNKALPKLFASYQERLTAAEESGDKVEYAALQREFTSLKALLSQRASLVSALTNELHRFVGADTSEEARRYYGSRNAVAEGTSTRQWYGNTENTRKELLQGSPLTEANALESLLFLFSAYKGLQQNAPLHFNELGERLSIEKATTYAERKAVAQDNATVLAHVAEGQKKLDQETDDEVRKGLLATSGYEASIMNLKEAGNLLSSTLADIAAQLRKTEEIDKEHPLLKETSVEFLGRGKHNLTVLDARLADINKLVPASVEEYQAAEVELQELREKALAYGTYEEALGRKETAERGRAWQAYYDRKENMPLTQEDIDRRRNVVTQEIDTTKHLMSIVEKGDYNELAKLRGETLPEDAAMRYVEARAKIDEDIRLLDTLVTTLDKSGLLSYEAKSYLTGIVGRLKSGTYRLEDSSTPAEAAWTNTQYMYAQEHGEASEQHYYSGVSGRVLAMGAKGAPYLYDTASELNAEYTAHQERSIADLKTSFEDSIGKEFFDPIRQIIKSISGIDINRVTGLIDKGAYQNEGIYTLEDFMSKYAPGSTRALPNVSKYADILNSDPSMSKAYRELQSVFDKGSAKGFSTSWQKELLDTFTALTAAADAYFEKLKTHRIEDSSLAKQAAKSEEAEQKRIYAEFKKDNKELFDERDRINSERLKATGDERKELAKQYKEQVKAIEEAKKVWGEEHDVTVPSNEVAASWYKSRTATPQSEIISTPEEKKDSVYTRGIYDDLSALMKQGKVVFYDLETTGTNTKKDQITQVSAVPMNPDGTFGERYSRYVMPTVPINPEASRITGITEQTLLEKGAVDAGTALSDFAKYIKSFGDDVVLVGFNNKKFDDQILQRQLKENNLAIDNKTYDAMQMSQAMVSSKSYSLESMAGLYGIVNPAAHDATADAETTARLTTELINKYDQERTKNAETEAAKRVEVAKKEEEQKKEGVIKIGNAKAGEDFLTKIGGGPSVPPSGPNGPNVPPNYVPPQGDWAKEVTLNKTNDILASLSGSVRTEGVEGAIGADPNKKTVPGNPVVRFDPSNVTKLSEDALRTDSTAVIANYSAMAGFKNAEEMLSQFDEVSEKAGITVNKVATVVREGRTAIEADISKGTDTAKVLIKQAGDGVAVSFKSTIDSLRQERDAFTTEGLTKIGNLSKDYPELIPAFSRVNTSDVSDVFQMEEQARQVAKTLGLTVDQAVHKAESGVGQVTLAVHKGANQAKVTIKQTGDGVKTTVDELGKHIRSKGWVSGLQNISYALSSVFRGISVKQLVSAAGAAEKALKSLQATTGKYAEEALAMVDVLNESYGMAKTQAAQAITYAYNQISEVGMSNQQALQMSDALVRLGADYSAYYGGAKSAMEVTQALTQVMLGSYRAARQYGIAISSTDVEQLAIGYGKQASELSEAEKMMYRYQIVMSRGTNVMGEYARTTDTYFHAQQELNRAWADAKIALGDEILPIVTKLLTGLTSLVDVLGEGGLTSKFTFLLATVLSCVPAFSRFARAIQTLSEVTKLSSLALGGWIGGIIAALAVLISITSNIEKEAKEHREAALAATAHKEALEGLSSATLSYTNAIASGNEELQKRAQLELQNALREVTAGYGENREQILDKRAQYKANEQKRAELTSTRFTPSAIVASGVSYSRAYYEDIQLSKDLKQLEEQDAAYLQSYLSTAQSLLPVTMNIESTVSTVLALAGLTGDEAKEVGKYLTENLSIYDTITANIKAVTNYASKRETSEKNLLDIKRKQLEAENKLLEAYKEEQSYLKEDYEENLAKAKEAARSSYIVQMQDYSNAVSKAREAAADAVNAEGSSYTEADYNAAVAEALGGPSDYTLDAFDEFQRSELDEQMGAVEFVVDRALSAEGFEETEEQLAKVRQEIMDVMGLTGTSGDAIAASLYAAFKSLFDLTKAYNLDTEKSLIDYLSKLDVAENELAKSAYERTGSDPYSSVSSRQEAYTNLYELQQEEAEIARDQQMALAQQLYDARKAKLDEDLKNEIITEKKHDEELEKATDDYLGYITRADERFIRDSKSNWDTYLNNMKGVVDEIAVEYRKLQSTIASSTGDYGTVYANSIKNAEKARDDTLADISRKRSTTEFADRATAAENAYKRTRAGASTFGEKVLALLAYQQALDKITSEEEAYNEALDKEERNANLQYIIDSSEAYRAYAESIASAITPLKEFQKTMRNFADVPLDDTSDPTGALRTQRNIQQAFWDSEDRWDQLKGASASFVSDMRSRAGALSEGGEQAYTDLAEKIAAGEFSETLDDGILDAMAGSLEGEKKQEFIAEMKTFLSDAATESAKIAKAQFSQISGAIAEGLLTGLHSLDEIFSLYEQNEQTHIQNQISALKKGYDDMKEQMDSRNDQSYDNLTRSQKDAIERQKKMDEDELKRMEGQIEAQEALLEESRRKEFERQKAFNIAEATISGIKGAIDAYTSMAYLGPVFGIAAAAAVTAFTAAKINALASQEYQASYAQGAYNLPQDQIAQVHKGEMIIPRPFAEEIRDNGGFSGGDITVNVYGATDEVSVEENSSSDNRQIDIYLTKRVKTMVVRGELDNALQTRYAISRNGRRG